MMKQFQSNSYLFGGNAPYVEEMYEAYLDNPASVPENWRTYFDALQNVPASDGTQCQRRGPRARSSNRSPNAPRPMPSSRARLPAATTSRLARKQVYVQSLIAAYRFLGSHWANLDPLKRRERPAIPELEPAFYDFTEADMDQAFSATNLYFGFERASLREIVKALRETYCGTIGAEYMYITDPEREALVAGEARVDPLDAELHARQEEAHPRPPDGRRRPRALPAHQVRRPEALLARRRRELHRLDGRSRAARRRQGRAGNRHRHGPPRPSERAGQHARQDADGPVRRVRASTSTTCRPAT